MGGVREEQSGVCVCGDDHLRQTQGFRVPPEVLSPESGAQTREEGPGPGLLAHAGVGDCCNHKPHTGQHDRTELCFLWLWTLESQGQGWPVWCL
jgi:hypothetical protein